MIKLIVGTKGTGKTKTLIDMARKAAEESKGNVVCVEKGDKLGSRPAKRRSSGQQRRI